MKKIIFLLLILLPGCSDDFSTSRTIGEAGPAVVLKKYKKGCGRAGCAHYLYVFNGYNADEYSCSGDMWDKVEQGDTLKSIILIMYTSQCPPNTAKGIVPGPM